MSPAIAPVPDNTGEIAGTRQVKRREALADIVAAIDADIAQGFKAIVAFERHGLPKSTYYDFKKNEKENSPAATTDRAS